MGEVQVKGYPCLGGGVCMIITNEELENYLELCKKTEGDKITVSRDLFLTLATEALICREQAIEEREVSLLRC